MGFVRFLFFLFMVIAIGQVIRARLGSRRNAAKIPNGNLTQGGPMVQDPYCETYIPTTNALARRIRGQLHYFCSAECAVSYEKDASFVRPGGAAESN